MILLAALAAFALISAVLLLAGAALAPPSARKWSRASTPPRRGGSVRPGSRR